MKSNEKNTELIGLSVELVPAAFNMVQFSVLTVTRKKMDKFCAQPR